MTAPAPSPTTVAERRIELAKILATGYLRLVVQGRISSGELAEAPPGEASCHRVVNGRRTNPKRRW